MRTAVAYLDRFRDDGKLADVSAATADSITIAGVGETISGTGYLKNGVASDISIFGSESNVAVDPLLANSVSRFNTAGVYALTLWIDQGAFDNAGKPTVALDPFLK